MEKFISQFTAIEIENRLKDVTSKAGYFYFDEANNKYLVFTDENTKDIYLDTQNPKLIIGELSLSEKESETYAEIYLDVPMYNVVACNSKNNRLAFTFDIKNKQGNSTGEEIIVKYNITNGNHVTELTESKFFGQQVELSVDKYLKEGTNTIFITITSKISKASTSVSVIYNAISISIEDYLDISKVYDLSNNKEAYLEIPYTVSGSHTKLMEWYLDGEPLELNRSEDEILETVPVSRTKTIKLSNLSHGRHNIQFRVSTKVNGEIFYSNTLYRDFFVYTGLNDHIMLGVAVTLPNTNEINGSLVIPNMIQYEGYELKIASYSPLNIAKTDINILLEQENISTIASSNNQVTNITITPITPGAKELKLIADEIELESQIEYLIPTTIAATSMNLTEITSGLELDFLAKGYNNNSSDRDQWYQNGILGTLTGFKWNNTSGWVNNRLEIDADSEIHFNYSPLSDHTNGKTIEIEWMSRNVSNEDAILCDLTNEEGTGILITASSIIVTSKGKTELIEKYKRDENIRAGIVINPSNRGTNKGLIFIYINGIVSRAINYLSGDNFISNKELYFKGTSEAGVSLKAIKVYGEALTSDQMLNNYNLYRDTVSEMYEVYDRNNIYEDNKISPSKMNSRLPVMIVTGDIPTLENTNDKDTQIVVDIEYTNMQDPSRSFKMKGAAMRPQGTSSMGYPKKNFRIYTQKLDSTILEVNGSIVENKLYSFKKGAIPVNCWCLKADYAESSGTHNTGIAKLWGNAFKNALVTCDLGEDNPHSVKEATVLRTRAQQCAIDNGYPYDVRTTIDGFPILLFYRRTEQDDIIFIGKYNFNNDKSTELVFGFKDIPGFDNSRMQCWEFLNNGNPIGLFTDISAFYNDVIDDKGKAKKGWEIAFEARYPDKSTNTTDLFNFAKWINGINGDHTRFAEEKWNHFDVYKVAGYYCYLNRHAAADQFVKNAMFTSEDGIHFYFILYDNDTINGLNNTGDIAILPTDDRESTYTDGSHKFAGYDSVLWNMLENDEEFMVVVRAVDNALYQANISYGSAINTFNNEQADKWVEKVYNLDAEYKYITPYTQNGINNLFMLQGKREVHRKWWLSNRFSLYDSLFVSGTYKSGYIEIKCIDETQPVQTFKVTSGYPLYYGYGINGNLRQRTDILLQPNESHIFSIDEKVNLGDPIAIYGAPHIKELDLSSMVDRIAVLQLAGVYNNDLGTKLEKLTIGSNSKENIRLQEVSGIKNAVSLSYLDITNLKGLTGIDLSENIYLKELRAKGTNLYAINFAEGSPINYLELPATFKNIDFKSLADLSFDNVKHEDFNAVEEIKITNCPNLSNDFNWVYNWYANKRVSNDKAVLHMDNIMWEGVDYQQLLALANIRDLQLKGKVAISEGSQEIVNALKEVFGDTVFNKTSDFYIQAPNGIYLSGPSKLLEGESARYVCAVFSEEEGRVQFSLESSRTGCSINKESGVLTTTENGLDTSEISIRASFISNSGKVTMTSQTVTIEKRVYPSSVTLNGETLINEQRRIYTLAVEPSNITGDYRVEWELSGDSSYLTIESSDDTQCVLKRVQDGILDFTLTAKVIKTLNNSIILSVQKTVSLVISGVVLTKSINSELQRCLYEKGLVANEEYSLDWELAIITSDQINPTNNASGSIFRNYNIKRLDELKYFTGLTSIPNETFQQAALTSVVIPGNVKRIGEQAFRICYYLETLEIREGVESIDRNAFYNCDRLKAVELPETVTSIGDGAFENLHGAERITIPSSVTTLGRYVCRNSVMNSKCEIVVKANIPNSTDNNSSFYGAKYGKLTIEEGVTSIGDYAFQYAQFSEIQLPNNSLKYIGRNAFKNTTAPSITIPASVESYGYGPFCWSCFGEVTVLSTAPLTNQAFSSSSSNRGALKKATIASSSLGNQTFQQCTGLLEVTLLDTVETIGEYSFQSCSALERIYIPASIKSSGKEAFASCTALKEVHVTDLKSWMETDFANGTANPFRYSANLYFDGDILTDLDTEGVSRIKERAFAYCGSLKKVNISQTVTEVASNAFVGCTLESIVVDESNSVFDSRNNCNALIFTETDTLQMATTTTIVPSSVKIIGPSAFNGLPLDNLLLPDGVVELKASALANVTVKNQLSLPSSLTTMDRTAFSGIKTKILLIDCDLPFRGSQESAALFYSLTLEELRFGKNCTFVAQYTFHKCTIKYLEIANAVLDSVACYLCPYPEVIRFTGTGTIKRVCFYNGGGSTKKIYLSNLETYLTRGDYSFFLDSNEDGGYLYLNDELVTDIQVPSSVVDIVLGCFINMKYLRSVTLPYNVSSIGGDAFTGCSNLKTILCYNSQAPSSSSNTFGSSATNYTGLNSSATGENILYVPQGATGYDTGVWLDPLQNSDKCGFTISYTL